AQGGGLALGLDLADGPGAGGAGRGDAGEARGRPAGQAFAGPGGGVPAQQDGRAGGVLAAGRPGVARVGGGHRRQCRGGGQCRGGDVFPGGGGLSGGRGGGRGGGGDRPGEGQGEGARGDHGGPPGVGTPCDHGHGETMPAFTGVFVADGTAGTGRA